MMKHPLLMDPTPPHAVVVRRRDDLITRPVWPSFVALDRRVGLARQPLPLVKVFLRLHLPVHEIDVTRTGSHLFRQPLREVVLTR